MLRSLGLAFLVSLVAAGPAAAATLPFGDVPARAADASAVLAPDGRLVVARFAPDGALEVRERPRGGGFGATVTIPPVTVEPQPRPNLQLLMGADGTAAILFDAGAARYASLRPPGGAWSRPYVISLAGAQRGQAAIDAGGALWAVGPDPGDEAELEVSRRTADGMTHVTPLPAPPPGTRDLTPALAVAPAGGAHVVYAERGSVDGGPGCLARVRVRAVTVPVAGAVLPPATLDVFDASGPGSADACNLDSGETVVGAPLLAIDATGADTAVYSVLTIDPFVVRAVARQRASGEVWPAPPTPPEPIGGMNVFAERLIGGAGAPLAVVRAGSGTATATRGADGAWATAPLADGTPFFEAARTSAGSAAFAWSLNGQVFGRLLGREVTLLGPGTTVLAVAGDPAGDATALFTRPEGDGLVLVTDDVASVAPAPAPTPTPSATPSPTAAPSPAPAAAPSPAAAPPIAAPLRAGPQPTPTLRRLSLTPRRPHAGQPLTLTLTTATRVQLSVRLSRAGRFLLRGVSRPLAAGTQRVRLPRLTAGTWRVSVTVTDAAGRSERRSLLVRIHGWRHTRPTSAGASAAAIPTRSTVPRRRSSCSTT